MLKTMAGYGMILAVLLSFLLSFVSALAPGIESFILLIVAILGILVGYMNITQKETMKALWWSIGFGLIGFGFIALIPYIGPFLGTFIKSIGFFFTCAAGTFLFIMGVKLFGKK